MKLRRVKFRRIAAMVVIAAGTLFVGSTTPAAAAINGSQFEFESRSVSGSFGQHLSITIRCENPGWKVVSIGATGTTITSMRPTPTFDGAIFTGLVSYGPTLIGNIACVEPASVADILHIEVRTYPNTAGFRDSVERCPAGMIGFNGGGGFSSGDADYMSADLVTADGRGWEFGGHVLNSSESSQLDLFCAPDDGTTFMVSGGVASTGFIQTVRAQCPPGYTAFGGGAYAAAPDGSPASGGFFIEDQMVNQVTAWEVMGAVPAGGKLVAVTRCTL